jgi:periplasmic divalent cation tolerance protein
MKETEFIIAYTTFPQKALAKKLAKVLIAENLIACANIFKLDSVYTWKSKLEETIEYGAFMKTRKELYGEVEKRILELHPYDCPEIIQIPISEGNSKYLSWIKNETKQKEA